MKIISKNKDKYGISKISKVLKTSRTTFYYKRKIKQKNIELENIIIKIFYDNKKNYGTRRLQKELSKIDIRTSRKTISKVMKKHNLVSNYTKKSYKVFSKDCNNSLVENLVDRKFDGRKDCEVLVSDTTYVRVANSWNYVCTIINLYNRAVVGFSISKNKDANMVYKALVSSKVNFSKVEIFHTDRGSEFCNYKIDNFLKAFNIKRSLSHKGSPHDNAVAEAFYKTLKTEFIHCCSFASIYQLERELTEYINWYNSKRLHSSLGYVAPLEYVA